MENPGHALSRAQLFEEVWGSEFVGVTRTVDVHMQTLAPETRARPIWLEFRA